jgi:hypothetical protein
MTIPEIKALCQEVISKDEATRPGCLRGDFTPQAARALLLAIDGLGDVANSDGDPHTDEGAEYWAKERSSSAAKEKLDEICKLFPQPAETTKCNMNKTYKTNVSLAGCKRWAKIGSTKNFATFCLLEWSRDLVGELGVMFLTGTTVKVKNIGADTYYKKGIGKFILEDREKITIKAKHQKPTATTEN